MEIISNIILPIFIIFIIFYGIKKKEFLTMTPEVLRRGILKPLKILGNFPLHVLIIRPVQQTFFKGERWSMARKFTDRDREILDFIIAFREKKGFSPTIREISRNCYLSKSATIYHIEKLCELGKISLTPNTARSIILKKSS